jgi:hypothetical protein
LFGRGSRRGSSIQSVIVQVDGAKGRLEPTLIGIVAFVEAGVVRDVDDGSKTRKNKQKIGDGHQREAQKEGCRTTIHAAVRMREKYGKQRQKKAAVGGDPIS